MKRPSSLVPGNNVRLVAPSRWVEEELVTYAEAQLLSRGFTTSRGENLLARKGQLAGTDEQRASDLQYAWQDPTVGAIWALRGGYGAQRLLPLLEGKLNTEKPKWYLGFSDSTAIHGFLNCNGCQSLHAAMWSTMKDTDPVHIDATFNVLTGMIDNVDFPYTILDRPGTAEGRLVGGNLSVLQTMIGTSTFPVKQGDILFIEDLDEMLYHLDRMVLHFSRAGILEKLSAILLGSMSDMRDNTVSSGFTADNPFGMTAAEILTERFKDLGVPVVFGFPAGHGQANLPLVLGANVRLDVAASGNRLVYL